MLELYWGKFSHGENSGKAESCQALILRLLLRERMKTWVGASGMPCSLREAEQAGVGGEVGGKSKPTLRGPCPPKSESSVVSCPGCTAPKGHPAWHEGHLAAEVTYFPFICMSVKHSPLVLLHPRRILSFNNRFSTQPHPETARANLSLNG